MPKHETAIRSIVLGLFLLLIFSLGLMKLPAGANLAPLTLTDLLFPLVFISWSVAIATGYCEFKWRVEFLAFALYFLALLISSIFSVDPRLSFVRLAGAAYLILLAVVASNIVTTLDHLRLSLLAWVAGSVLPLIAGLITIVLFYFIPDSPLLSDLTHHYGAVPAGNFPRISSTFVSASMFCNYLTVTLIFTLASARMRWIGHRVAAAIVLAIGVSAMFTVSIALGGFILATGLWAYISLSNKVIARTALVFAGAIALAFLAMAPFALSLRPGPSIFERLIRSSRFLVWGDAVKTFLADPLTGNGLGTAAANVVFQNYDGSRSLLTDAHNVFLSIAAQAGLPGLIGIIAIIIFTFKAGLSATGVKDKETVYIRHCLLIAFFAAFVYDGLTGSFEDVRYLWILIGLILAAKSITDEPGGSIPVNSA